MGGTGALVSSKTTTASSHSCASNDKGSQRRSGIQGFGVTGIVPRVPNLPFTSSVDSAPPMSHTLSTSPGCGPHSGPATLTQWLSSWPTAPGGAPAHGEGPSSLTRTSLGDQPLSTRTVPLPHTRSCARSRDAPPSPRDTRTRTPPAVRPTAHDASGWPTPFPRSGSRSKQSPVCRAAPPRERGHWCSP